MIPVGFFSVFPLGKSFSIRSPITGEEGWFERKPNESTAEFGSRIHRELQAKALNRMPDPIFDPGELG